MTTTRPQVIARCCSASLSIGCVIGLIMSWIDSVCGHPENIPPMIMATVFIGMYAIICAINAWRGEWPLT